MLSNRKRLILIGVGCALVIGIVLVVVLYSRKENIDTNQDVSVGQESDYDNIVDGDNFGKDSTKVDKYEPEEEKKEEAAASSNTPQNKEEEGSKKPDNIEKDKNDVDDNPSEDEKKQDGEDTEKKEDNKDNDGGEEPATNLTPEEDNDSGFGPIRH